MLAIQQTKDHKGQCTANVLPCRINHNGPVNTSERYWAPTTEGTFSPSPMITSSDLITPDGKQIAYFRGRKLHGKHVKIPKGYRGVVLSSTERVLPKVEPEQDLSTEVVVEEEAEEDVGIMEENASFEDLMLWGHETLPDETADPYIRGVEEWIDFAEQVRKRAVAIVFDSTRGC